MKEENKKNESPKSEILSLVRSRLISVYGKLNAVGYTTIGIVNDSIPDDWQSQQSYSEQEVKTAYDHICHVLRPEFNEGQILVIGNLILNQLKDNKV